MLRKLIKHEFLDTYKLLCIYYAVVAVLTVLCSISVTSTSNLTNKPNSLLLQIILFLTQIAYSGMLSMLGLITIVALCSHFNKTMYGDRGYLTHTLPVPKGSILASKYLVSLVWCVVSLLVMFLSLLIFACFLTGENLFAKFFLEMTNAKWAEMDAFAQGTFGCGLIPLIYLSILSAIVAVMHLFSFLWACISIGQLANEHRNLIGIFAGIGVWFAEFFIRQGIQKLFHLSFYGDILETALASAEYNPNFDQALLIYLVMGLLFFAAETCVTWFISSKKLNLA